MMSLNKSHLINFKKTNEINGFKKYSEVPQELISKFKGIVPDKLIYLWENYGLGMYADGFLQLVNPDEYEFVFNYINKTLLPSFVFGITAFCYNIGFFHN